MCGSGTACKAAKQLRRNYIGIYISEEYCKLAKKRVESAEVIDHTAVISKNGKTDGYIKNKNGRFKEVSLFDDM